MSITHKHFPCRHHEFFHNLTANKETDVVIVLEYDNQSLFGKGISYYFPSPEVALFQKCVTMNFLEDQVNTQLYYIEDGINNQYKKFRLREQAKQQG